MRSSHGLLRPGRFLWARVLAWSVVLGVALWIVYKFVKGVTIDLGLGGTGLPTTIGALATLALYTASVRLIERRAPDQLGLAQLCTGAGSWGHVWRGALLCRHGGAARDRRLRNDRTDRRRPLAAAGRTLSRRSKVYLFMHITNSAKLVIRCTRGPWAFSRSRGICPDAPNAN